MAVEIETVPVGNPGNSPDNTGYGAVDYEYRIGKYEVTNAQYCAFLNAVAPNGTDPYDLYSTDMADSSYGGITFMQGNPSGSKYAAKPGRAGKPVNYVNFWDACRFTNWLHNGQGSGDTETGAYTLMPDDIVNNAVRRNPESKWAITSEDEWYKAAYYDGASSGYYNYPTGSDVIPTAEAPSGTNMTSGSANYLWVIRDMSDVGAYTSKPSDSPYGTLDQAGNVWEWNETINGGARGLRGGSFISRYDFYGNAYGYGMYSSCRVSTVPPLTGVSAELGFRVVQIPEPTTLVLLSLGGLAMIRRRKRGEWK